MSSPVSYMPRAYCTPQDIYDLFGSFAERFPQSRLIRDIQLATAYFENQTNDRIIPEQSYTEEVVLLAHRNRIGLQVTAYPITSVTAMGIRWPGATTFTPVSSPQLIDFLLRPLRFIYYTGPEAYTGWQGYNYASGYNGQAGQVQITYTAGFTPIPQDVVLAVASLTMEMCLRAINPFGSNSVSASAEGASNSLSLGDISQNLKMAKEVITKYTAWE